MAIHYDYDHILENYTGSAGRWQLTQFLLLVFLKISYELTYFIHLFAAYTPSHRCRISLCDDESSQYNEPWTNISIPQNHPDFGGAAFLQEAGDMASCNSFSIVDGAAECAAASFIGNSTSPCSSYVYDQTLYSETVATKFDLVCDNTYKRGLMNSAILVGNGIGSVIVTLLGDKFGRRPMLIIGMTVSILVTLAGAFVTNAETYIFLKLMTAISQFLCLIPGSILIMELFAPAHRTVAFAVNTFMETMTVVLLGPIAYLQRDWSALHLTVGLSGIPGYIIMLFFFKESVRWQIVNDKRDEAKTVIKDIAKVNGRPLAADDDEKIDEILKVISKRSEKTKTNNAWSVMTLFRQPFLYTTLVVGCTWITTCWAYFALILNATNLSGDIYVNYSITWLLDLPVNAYLLLASDRVGRRKSISFCIFILGCSCLAMAFIPKDYSLTMMILFQMGKFFGGVVNYTIIMFISELYPTTMRACAVGGLGAVVRLISSGFTLILMLDRIWTPLPLVVLALPPILLSFIVPTLSETSGVDLPENLKDIQEAKENWNQERDQLKESDVKL